MQLGFSKKVLESILDDMLNIILHNIKQNKKIKISNFGTFELRYKKQREGRNPKTKEIKIISARNVILFKPSKYLREFINSKNE
tara:strand:- start:201 stop:452 length:252 start_codon:yes stop_codon:yes gene_type:complete